MGSRRCGLWKAALLSVQASMFLAVPALSQEPATLSAPLPSGLKERGKLVIGVKCDYPPFGSVDGAGKNVGFEIDVARRLGELAFGKADATELTCVSGPNRIPFITSGRVDGIISVLSYTPDRTKVIRFSDPYFDSGVRMIVPKDSTVQDWADLKGKNVTTTIGGTPSIWLKTCMPDVNQLLFDNTASSVQALKQGRAVAFPQDVTLLVGLTAKDPSLKIVGSGVVKGPFGVGMKLDDSDFGAWVNAAIAKMRDEDFFWTALKRWIPENAIEDFKDAVPRPSRAALTYAGTEDIYRCQ